MATPAPKPPFSEKELKDFLAERNVLVVSTQPTSAKALRKLIMQVGSKVDRTFNTFSYEEAEKELNSRPIHILFSDLTLDKKSGLDLISIQEKQFTNRMDVASIMMCGDPSPAEAAMMAEANVDAVMIKPFNFENFKTALYQALKNKVNPSPYWKLIETGKEHYHKNEFTSAIPMFEKSKSLDPKPTLAFYYRGQIHRKLSEFPEAIKSFKDGLNFSPNDFLCLNAVFDTHLQCSEYDLAYEAATRLHKDYPVSTSRILDLVKLSVYGKKYEDIVDYYEVFKKVERREGPLVRVVIAGMLICAKYMVISSKRDKGLEVLQNAAKVSSENKTLTGEVFRYFIENGYHAEAEKYYGSLGDDVKEQKETKMMFLEMVNATQGPAEVVQQGSLFYKQGVKTPRLFELLIEASIKVGRSPSTVNELIQEAETLFPDKLKSKYKLL